MSHVLAAIAVPVAMYAVLFISHWANKVRASGGA